MDDARVVVIGAGPSGLVSAAELRRAGVSAVVLDRAEAIGSSWRGRYDRLRLNSSRWFSKLSRERYARGTPLFPTRDQLVAYLESFAEQNRLDIRLGTTVHRVDRVDRGWTLDTSDGEISAEHVIVATGYENSPFIPDWPGRESYGGRLLHAAEYRNAEPFGGAQVLVVGSGCSGMEIAYDLAEGGASKVWLSARTPPNIILREGPAGLPGDLLGVTLLHFPTRVADAMTRFGRRMDIGDLTEFGLPVPEEGVFSRMKRLGVAPTIVDKEVIEAIKARQVEVVAGVESLDETGVRLADGNRIEPDAVIAATGYRRGLESLVGHLGVLDESGAPRASGEELAPGLRFVGFVSRPGAIGYMAGEARRMAKEIARTSQAVA